MTCLLPLACVCFFFLFCMWEWACLCDVYVCLFVYLYKEHSIEETLVCVIGNLIKITHSNTQSIMCAHTFSFCVGATETGILWWLERGLGVTCSASQTNTMSGSYLSLKLPRQWSCLANWYKQKKCPLLLWAQRLYNTSLKHLNVRLQSRTVSTVLPWGYHLPWGFVRPKWGSLRLTFRCFVTFSFPFVK